jgi:hexokinase
MYLGEIARHVMLSLVDAAPKPLLFGGKSTPALNKHYGVDTSFMSATEEAWIGDEDSSEDAFVLPPLGTEFKKEAIAPKVVSKLDKIRSAIAKFLGFKEQEITLNDAAVSNPLFVSPPRPHASVKRLFAGFVP